MSEVENTVEDVEAAKAAKAQEDARKADEKAQREAKRAAEKAAKAEAKEREKANRVAEKEAKARLKAEAKEAEKAKREAERMPEQNGIRRPKPDTLCGKAWAIFDSVSAKRGEAASIGESMDIAREQGLNEANVRAEYARWRKFYNITGRVSNPTIVKPEPAPEAVSESAEG